MLAANRCLSRSNNIVRTHIDKNSLIGRFESVTDVTYPTEVKAVVVGFTYHICCIIYLLSRPACPLKRVSSNHQRTYLIEPLLNRCRTCISIDPDAIVCAAHSEFIGEVFIGKLVGNRSSVCVKWRLVGRGTIIHPSVRIIAEAGPIFIGDENIIEEQCVIVNR